MKFSGTLHSALIVFVVALLHLTVAAQQAGGVITGRVITEDGLPLSHAKVSLFGVSGRTKQTTIVRETVTDDDGNFRTDGLEAIPYFVSAWAPGYLPAPDGEDLDPFEPGEARFVRVGQLVTVKMIRGGVITGRVTNDAGDAVVGVPVKATRVMDETGRPTSGDVSYAHLWIRSTDDRGVYRIYGLAPGSYMVAAGGSNPSSARSTPFAGRATTYHPSSTRDTATLVKVSSGAEATGIDIRYRGESGFAISGKIHGAPSMTQTTTVYLRSPTLGETIETTSSQTNGYVFYGVPNGEYEVIATNDGTQGENGFASTPRRVAVKGADVTGADLTLLPHATISGVVVVVKEKSGSRDCRNQRESHPEEIIIRARRDDPTEKRSRLLPMFPGYGVGIPDDKGTFTIRDLKSGRHRIQLELPDETWYWKTMAMTGSKTATDPRAGLTLKFGDKLNGLRLIIASGAAMLKGKITVAENTKFPTRLTVHLIPAEAEAIDDVLRFAETSAEPDGAFTFRNIPPGKYFVLARTITNDKLMRPAAWEPAERQKLRKEAEAANLTIELKPCQQITGYALRLTK